LRIANPSKATYINNPKIFKWIKVYVNGLKMTLL